MLKTTKSKRVLLLIIGVLFHLLYLWSIFDIYFVSPLVHGMKQHLSTEKPPAKRLFLIVGDGQRADKTLGLTYHPTSQQEEYLAPYLRSIVLEKGTYGISHTRMPTESRPGHVAMIAGFYEDVSAVTKGWKENPVDFDSVFNQSTHTYSFGSPDILPMFATGASDKYKIDTWMYGHEFEDFTSSSIELDRFVFDHFYDLMANSTTNETLKNEIMRDGNVFFLHLLGTDTSGHSYRPYSAEYYDNIKYTDAEIAKLVEFVHDYFGDDDTAFIFNSDHGMSDFGSHGDGHPNNTRTPLICWGAGINTPVKIDPSENQYLEIEKEEMKGWELDHIKRHDVKQADIASLMSYLVGLNYPSNSVGELPMEFIKNPENDKINGLYRNTLGILEQYLVKLDEVKYNQYKFVEFPEFEAKPVEQYQSEIEDLIKIIETGDVSKELETIQLIEEFASVTLKGLDYLQKYNWLLLRSIVTMGFVGWIVYSFIIFLQLFILKSSNSPEPGIYNYAFFGTITSVLVYTLYYKKSPINYYLYLAFPVFFWQQITTLNSELFSGLAEFFKGLSKLSIALILAGTVIFFEAISYGFMHREIFSILFIIVAFYPLLISFKKFQFSVIAPWIVTCLLLAYFPIQNPVKTESLLAIVSSGIIVIFTAVLALIYLLSAVKVSNYTRNLLIIQIVLVGLAIASTARAVIYLQARAGLPKDAQILGWLNVPLSLIVLPALHGLKSNSNYQVRCLVIYLTFAPFFLISTISFETFFYVLYSIYIYQWIEVESILNEGSDGWLQLFRVALLGFFNTQIAFFGTGNISSISTFSLDSVYRLIPIFDPFSQGAFLMLKLIIPYVLLSVGLGLMNVKLHLKQFSLSTLLISLSDLLSLNFFYSVKTEVYESSK
ncbi:unnamed protein product [Ambrosiozyma monospora]|uniref:GPI ethanolamine phosphate transferase 1 n=1 Tax=Ambrosiozyma monospora TaxID=43982 RepID=A0A9W6Z114_AMBMO|nr:unnamed protein product [Ambrosiozyma monospora]